MRLTEFEVGAKEKHNEFQCKHSGIIRQHIQVTLLE